jgi:hypothetical protein
MARIRTVKPELFRHEGLYDLEIETKLPIRTAFAGLFTACDREGRFEWLPKTLKLDCLPHDEIDFSRVLDALLSRGFISKYTSDNKLYGFIPSWLKHQVINNKETASKIPSPHEESSQIIDSTRQRRVDDASTTRADLFQGEGKGREVGKEGKGILAFNFVKHLIELGVDQKIIDDWMKVRKAKKSSNTEAAMNLFISEASKCGLSIPDAVLLCAGKSWAGLDSTWILKGKSNSSFSTQDYRKGVNDDGSF